MLEVETAAARESTALLLEELSEGMTPLTLEWMTTLLGRGVIRIVACVESCPEFGVVEYFVGFVDSGHLGLSATLVRVGSFCRAVAV